MDATPAPNQKAKSQDEIFADLFRQLRVWNPQVPESPERLDPILRMLLQLYSHQLARLDQRIDQVWDVATRSLIKALTPESKRWPVPAFTVMRCEPLDPVVEIDQHTRFFYKEAREGGKTFFFSASRPEKLVQARVKHVFLVLDNSLIDLSPAPPGQTQAPPASVSLSGRGKGEIYLAIEFGGAASSLAGAKLFVNGDPEALHQLRWAYWMPGGADGEFSRSARFCPGLTSSVEQLFSERDDALTDWGGLRSSSDLFATLEPHFVILPEEFTAAWVRSEVNATLSSLLKSSGSSNMPAGEPLFWIKLELPPQGDRSRLVGSLDMSLSCFVALNQNELTLFKHAGGNRLVEIELPEDLADILEIRRVVDSAGREYLPRHVLSEDAAQRYYAMEERGNKLVLWFDFSPTIELVPDSVTVTYSVTSGIDANGIGPGKVTELYESHPGIASAENVLQTRGAMPAKTDEQILQEASARLRNRDRALSFVELARWATTFDRRILKAECANGIQRTARGVRRCITVSLAIEHDKFYSQDEIELMTTRVTGFLKSRAPVNTHFVVEVAAP